LYVPVYAELHFFILSATLKKLCR